MPRLRSLLPSASLALALATSPVAGRDLVEFYHTVFDHYFITANPVEIQALDTGVHAGWSRTGQTMLVFDAGDPRLAGSVPVCRFYGNPALGLDSHFYSATPEECEAVKRRFPDAWRLESDEVFRVHPLDPASGRCPAGTKPAYRLYNNRPDVNHRYTTDVATVNTMLSRGYLLEGTGGPVATVFCTADPAPPPPPPPPESAPACDVAASLTTLTIGAPLTLRATCSGTVSRYEWLACGVSSPDACGPLPECSTTSATCSPVARDAGRVLYRVRATSAAGTGSSSGIVVTWQPAPTAPPSCTVSANPSQPYAGSSTTLTATCTQSPTSWQWAGCPSPSGNTCRVSRATTGSETYSVTATNTVGTGAPASITLAWQLPPPIGADFCGDYTKVKRIDLVWGGFTQTNDPGGGLEADAVLVGRVIVPPNATGSGPGVISVVEFVNGPAERIMTLSPSPCDFRGFQPGVFPSIDPTGTTRPMAWSFGINPSTQVGLAGMAGSMPKLVPGQVYFVNMRSASFNTGGNTCGTEECNVRVTVNPPR